MIDIGGGHLVAATEATGAAARLNQRSATWSGGRGTYAKRNVVDNVDQQAPAAPTTLHALLSALDLNASSAVIAGPAGVVMDLSLRYLGALHGTAADQERRLPGSEVKRRALLDRVYGCLIDSLPEDIRYRARDFVEAYMERDQDLVHGEMWARNIVLPVIPVNDIEVLEGEHHFGDGTYDLACLASDYAMPLVRAGKPFEPLFNLIWYRYRGLRRGQTCGTEQSFRVHLALQLMRKLLGFETAPGPLGRADVIRGRVFYMNELIRWLR